MSAASTLTAVGPWECVAAEFGEKGTDNEGLVAFWVRMPEPRLCKADADVIGAAPRLKEINAELLEALKEWTLPIAEKLYRGERINETDAAFLLKVVRDAIAKAEGRP